MTMVDETQLASVPRGNTAPGVNRRVIEHLAADISGDGRKLLDVPCGDGTFLDSVKRIFPATETFGADIDRPAKRFGHRFFQIDARRGLLPEVGLEFDVITCISGVMEFDNTLSFFESLRTSIKPNGCLFVSNDNLLSVRDRFLFLFFGRHRQYKLAIPHDAPTWKILPLQNLLRILADAGFAVTAIDFVPPSPKEWLWLSLAAFVYPFQYLYLRFAETSADQKRKSEMYPFVSLLSRHYIVACRRAD